MHSKDQLTATPDLLQSHDKQITRFVGFTVEQVGPLNDYRQVVVTMPGFGDVAKQNFLAITENFQPDVKPTGVLISYESGFDRKRFIVEFVDYLQKLADGQPIQVAIHACSFSASLLPDLLMRLDNHPLLRISGAMLRTPLFAHEFFSDSFRKANLGTLARVFRRGIKNLQISGEIVIKEHAATELELLHNLPTQLSEQVLELLCTSSMPFFVTLLDHDCVINNTATVDLLAGYASIQTLASDEKIRMGHYPANSEVLQELVAHEHIVMEHFFAADNQANKS